MNGVGSERMTILHILALGPVGGLPRVVEALALGQREQGHDVHVAGVHGTDEEDDFPLLQTLEDAGVGVARIAVPRRGYREEYRQVTNLCRRLWPHLIHTHGYRPDLVGGLAARRLGIPVVTTVHGFTGGGLKNRLYEALQRRALRRHDAVCAVSRRLASDLAWSGIAAERVHFVPNGWHGRPAPLGRREAREALGIGGDHFQIGWVGRLSSEKGPDTLIEALGLIGHIPYVASILGNGPERIRLERVTSSTQLAWRVRWHGTVSDAGRHLAAFDLLVISSRTEGMPIVLFEAMAAGVPVIATDVGGVPEVVTPREAILVPPDDPEALALAIEAVYLDPEAAATRADAARRRLEEEFDMRRTLEEYENLYRGLRPEYRQWVLR